MKSIKIIFSTTFISVILLFPSCSDRVQPKSIGDQQLEKLVFTWKASSVTLDGISLNTYSNFKITFTGSPGSNTFSYATEGRPNLSPWPAAGTFTFDTVDPINKLIRDDQVTMTYAPAATSLSMIFNYSTAGYTSRVNSVKGKWDFEFTKQ